jgi:hypothetical protein
MSADQLHVTREEHSAMIEVLRMLERGELVKRLNMGVVWCGTIGCIGGWVAHIMGEDENCYANTYMFHGGGLQELYWNTDACLEGTTPDQAASALRNFLTTGNAQWAEVLAC